MQNLAFSQKNTNIFNYFSIFKLWTPETNYLKINANEENNQNILMGEILKYAYTNNVELPFNSAENFKKI